jgi:Flp pilus assembly protein TadG
MSFLRPFADSVLQTARAWRASRAANATMLFAAAIIPMVGIVGLGVDYYTGLSHKARLDAAADSAAIAAITTAKSYISANSSSQIEPLLTNSAIAAGQAQGAKVFAVNAAATAATIAAGTPTVTVTRTLQTFNATVTYSGNMKTSFGKLFTVPTFKISGSAQSSLTIGKYLDFYIALDVSASMGLATSTADQTTMFNSSAAGNCAFACHFPGRTQGFTFARANNIELRVDSVGYAVNQLIATANATKTLTNQFRIGLYPFIVDAITAAPLSADFTQATAVGASLSDYWDTNLTVASTKAMGSGGTHLDNLFSDLLKLNTLPNSTVVPSLGTSGDGSSALTPKQFVFIVTDGMNNSQYALANSNFQGGSNPQPPTNWGTYFGQSYCQAAQTAGVTVAILYIPYLNMTLPPTSAGEYGETLAADNAIPSIPGDLQKCAATGFFFTANSSADIKNAMQAMFFQALAAARLTN